MVSGNKIVKTIMMKRYFMKLIMRLSIFGVCFVTYISHKDLLYRFMYHELSGKLLPFEITPIHVLWGIL